eukprot:8876471-Pyramimonas_sp.AAC.1
MRSLQDRISHSTCWLSRVDRRRARMVWRAGGSRLRRPLQLFTTAVGIQLRMSCGLLAARSVRPISSLVARRRR